MLIFVTMKPEYSKYFKHPRLVLAKLLQYASPLFPDDEKYLRALYRLKFGERLDLENPQTYSAKLQWMKLYWRNPVLCRFIDKYEVKAEVAGRIGPQHVIPTFGVWEKAEDIDFDSLPDRFVLKCTHDCRSYILCPDKDALDRNAARRKLSSALGKSNYPSMREWGYKNVRPRIIAEAYLEDPSNPKELTDYKFFCFNGEAKAVYVATGRMAGDSRADYMDRSFNRISLFSEHPGSEEPLPVPPNYDEMLRIAETLSAGFPHVRIDLYNIGGKIYFGEYTFYHGGGMNEFKPREWDRTFGDWFKLPEPLAGG